MEKPIHQNQVLQTRRIIPYKPHEIYAAFANPVRLAKWWGPKDFTNTFNVFEFKIGGDWKFIMHGPDGHNYPNECVFSELKPVEKIVIQHVSPPRFTLSISLVAIDKGTQLFWVQEFEDPKVAEAVRHIAEPGNEQNLDRLQMHLRGELK
jgi:uncharacterized protein YndB with AHSA1/START domain